MTLEKGIQIAIGIMLIPLIYWDIRYFCIRKRDLGILLTVGIVLQFLVPIGKVLLGNSDYTELSAAYIKIGLKLLLAAGITAGMWFLAVATREGIGKGDVVCLLCLGIVLSWRKYLAMLLLSSVLAAIFGLVIMIVMHFKVLYEKNGNILKSARFPFIPVLAIAYWICVFG